MIYRIYIALLFILFHIIIKSQSNYSNSWINFQQIYFKIPIAEEGIYRITYNDLLNAGFPVNTIDPRQIQIFRLGQEQYIYIYGEQDGIFHLSDYIEFYGRPNDAEADIPLFESIDDITNLYYSYFNDTICYFLTYTAGINNKRMTIETDQNFSAYSSLPFVWKISRVNYTSTYYPGETNYFGLTDFLYTASEGWFDVPFSINPNTPGISTVITRQVPTPQVYSAGPLSEVDLKVVGASNYIHLDPDHHLMIQFPGHTIDTLYEGYKTIHIKRTVPSTLLGSQTTFTFTLLNDLGSQADRNAISYIQIRYPHTLHMENAKQLRFEVPSASGIKSVLNLTNINASSGESVYLWDLTTNTIIPLIFQNNTWRGITVNTNQLKQMLLVVESAKKTVPKIQPVNINYSQKFFVDYSDEFFSNVNYIIITHKGLYHEAQSYANYRRQTGFDVLLVDVETLYEQFAYGISKHPLAIKNFVEFTLDHFSDTIHGLFIIGKGYRAGEGAYNYRNNAQIYTQTLVPSVGNPPSDNLFTSRIGSQSNVPRIPIGRLAARKPSDVTLYLNKIRDFELAQQNPYNPMFPYENEWLKQVLHFAGGSNFSEGAMLESFLNVYKDSLEGPYFGANVRTFRKNSTDPFQQIISDSLKNIINNGVILMNFFGHAAGIGFDISIDNPAEYNNYKKYFFVLANSCLSGDLYQPTTTSTEAFVLIENKGAIGYIGSVTNTLASLLHAYSQNFIGGISYSNYGQTIGSNIQKTIQKIDIPGNHLVKDVIYSMTLHGDPVLKLHSFNKPDYLITSQQIRFLPSLVTSQLDTFEVQVIVKNLGKAVHELFVVELTRLFPDNTTETYWQLVQAPNYCDTIRFRLPVDHLRGMGMNAFTASVDAYFQIDELNENNNTATNTLFISIDDIIPIYPYEFAVLPNQTVTLIASTGNPFSSFANYIFEIDTTDLFNSPLKQTGTVNSAGGIVQWIVPFMLNTLGDSVVYYWRVQKEGSLQWRESSFQYISGKYGWGQAHYFQFKKNSFKGVFYNRPNRNFLFDTIKVWISAQTSYFDMTLNPAYNWYDQWIKVNGILRGSWSCANYYGHALKFAVFDSLTGEPWISYNLGTGYGQYGNLHCRNYDWWDFDFHTQLDDPAQQTEWHQRIISFLNLIPTGNYVFAMSHRNHNAQNYPDELYQAFESIGSAYIRIIPNNRPYMIFGKKGSVIGTAHESIGANLTSIIKNDYYIPTRIHNGTITSPVIGPSTHWKSIHWRIKPLNHSHDVDVSQLYVIGIKSNNHIDTLLGPINYKQDSIDIFNLENIISAQEYPKLQLVLYTSDDSLLTPSQLVSWHVMFDGVPETAISPNIHFKFYKDTVDQGEQIKMSIATKNISSVDFADTLIVDYLVRTHSGSIVPLSINKPLRLHPSQDILIDSITFSTRNFQYGNILWVEFNPVNVQTGQYDQIEQYHFNNIAQIPFFVRTDKINPILDVTFDGRRIIDGEIVSATPTIQIMVKDENKHLLLQDTSLINVFLKRPGGQFEPIHFLKDGRWQMLFYPATSSVKNVAKVYWHAQFPIDGIYALKVQVRDVSGNVSGDNEYIITFKIINKPTITEVMNWPNPFSTRTHFVFTLTGSKIPDYFKIQIMNISGVVVREIDKSELGPIYIGPNITQYAWDGTDQYGNQLANGVYFYRVITKIDGHNVELQQTPATKYFKNEIGKMVLIR